MAKRAQNHYEILGLSPTVSSAEIKRAYRELVKKCHPDVEYRTQSQSQRTDAHKRMQSINEAYETLMDYAKRAAYDFQIGARGRRIHHRPQPFMDDEVEREKYLKQVFHPGRKAVVRVLNRYKSKLQDLSQDIYDEELLEEFSLYVEEVEKTLRNVSYAFTESPPPPSLNNAVQWMRHAIAQAADGLDELQEFCLNYDYNHLSMAGNLFKIAIEHSRRALSLAQS